METTLGRKSFLLLMNCGRDGNHYEIIIGPFFAILLVQELVEKEPMVKIPQRHNFVTVW